MAKPQRKSPERKSGRKQPSVAARLSQAALSALGRHPRALAGTGMFVVVFSFVAANALWYQPHHHPAPLLATRMFVGETASPAIKVADVKTEPGVTTYRIERQEPSAVTEPAKPAVAEKPVASPLVRSIQEALAASGLYDGPADGMTGPKTVSAILFYEETEGLEPKGEATEALLARLKRKPVGPSVVPADRPSMVKTATTPKKDDVAALLSEIDTNPVAAVPVPKPVSPALIMKIQKALAGMAYKGVKVDGMAGDATRAAIRAFEKSYRMPVTGEPSEKLLKKMQSIGAV
jgi:peptidoglycan hydrolase-like protein with peptidoglycan-binding domain